MLTTTDYKTQSPLITWDQYQSRRAAILLQDSLGFGNLGNLDSLDLFNNVLGMNITPPESRADLRLGAGAGMIAKMQSDALVEMGFEPVDLAHPYNMRSAIRIGSHIIPKFGYNNSSGRVTYGIDAAWADCENVHSSLAKDLDCEQIDWGRTPPKWALLHFNGKAHTYNKLAIHMNDYTATERLIEEMELAEHAAPVREGRQIYVKAVSDGYSFELLGKLKQLERDAQSIRGVWQASLPQFPLTALTLADRAKKVASLAQWYLLFQPEWKATQIKEIPNRDPILLCHLDFEPNYQSLVEPADGQWFKIAQWGGDDLEELQT